MFQYIFFVLSAPLAFFKKFMSSPVSTLFYGLISKWYLLSMSLVVVVVYWVITGLASAGVFTKMEKIFIKASLEIKAVSKYCPPKINDLHLFLDCIFNTPVYTDSDIRYERDVLHMDISQDVQNAESHPFTHESDGGIVSPYRKYLQDVQVNTGNEQDNTETTKK